MDRGHGATFGGAGVNLQEYWDEYKKMIEETKVLDDYLDEECAPRSYDGELNFFSTQSSMLLKSDLIFPKKLLKNNRSNVEYSKSKTRCISSL